MPEDQILVLRFSIRHPTMAKYFGSPFILLVNSADTGWKKGHPVMEALPLALHDRLMQAFSDYVKDDEKQSDVVPGFVVDWIPFKPVPGTKPTEDIILHDSMEKLESMHCFPDKSRGV